MFGFGSKNEESTDEMIDMKFTMSKLILYDLEHGKVDFKDRDVQMFLPLAFSLVDWDWFYIVAGNITPQKEYHIFKEVLDNIHAYVEVNEQKLSNHQWEEF